MDRTAPSAALDGYLYAALWANELEGTYSREDFSGSAWDVAQEDLDHFYTENQDDLDAVVNWNYTNYSVGYDLWMTRNHHGVGFEDRGLGDRATALASSARAMKDSECYVGDDDKVYLT